MLGSIHLLVGALIGLMFSDTEAIVIVAFFSHYILDYIPHIDPATFLRQGRSLARFERYFLYGDAITIAILFTILFFNKEHWQHLVLGATVAQIPDWLMPLERYPLFSPLRRFHRMCHWNTHNADQWSSFIIGIVNSVAVPLVCAVLIWR